MVRRCVWDWGEDMGLPGEKSVPSAVRARGVWHSYALAARRAASGEKSAPAPDAVPRDAADLRGVDLDVPAGAFVAVVGANGSGKTTFARHLNALVGLQEGELEVCGMDVTWAAANPDAAWELRHCCGMVFQTPENQFVSTVVGEDVAFGPQNFGATPDEAQAAASAALAAVGLAGMERAGVHELSGGQQQRVALAGVLACAPQLIVLDEATSMLDPQGAADVLAAVGELRHHGEATVIAVTHDMEVAATADLVIVMGEGRVLAAGDPHDVLTDSDLLAAARLRPPVAARTWMGLAERGLVDADAPCPVTPEELAEAVSRLCA